MSQEASSWPPIFHAVRSAKASQHLGRIRQAIKLAEETDFAHQFVPSTLHSISTLYSSLPAGGSSLGGELVWGSVVISSATSTLNQYLKFKAQLQALVLSTAWDQAADLITRFELIHGSTIVTKELAIAVKQQSEGTIKQVAFSRRMQAASGGGAVANFVHFASERNEDRLTISSLQRTFRENYSARKVHPLISAILHWHALRQLPRDPGLLAGLLDYECTGSLFDYYEVYVVATAELAFSHHPELRAIIANGLKRISSIEDTRIKNILAVAEMQLAPADGASSRSLYSVLSSFPRSANGNTSPLQQTIESFATDDTFDTEVRRSVHKYGANFYHLDYFQAVFAHLEHKASINCFDHVSAPLVAVQFKNQSSNLLLACTSQLIRHSKLPGQLKAGPSDGEPSDGEARLSVALGHLAARDVDQLFEMMERADGLNALDKTHLLLLTVRACILSRRFVEFLPFAFVLSEIRTEALQLLDLVPALEQIYPKRLTPKESAIFSVVASRLLSMEDSDWIEDKLMVAAECALASIDSPPKWSTEDVMHQRVWVAFLNEVLQTNNVLLIDGIDSPRQALDLRLKALRQLIEVDPQNKTNYQEEVRDITFNLSVADGTKHVNTSRLYVNVQGLQKWATEHCKDDFERYKELVVGEATVEQPVNRTHQAGQSFLDQIAGIQLSAADDQLIALLLRIRNAYLLDPRNGLDAFISLRVRHGSLAGTLSRGFDNHRLLLLRKEDEGLFEPPSEWARQLDVDDTKLTQFNEVFIRFTTIFHSAIDDLLRNRLRVRSDRSPGGMIAIEVTDLLLKGYKQDILNGVAFDTFTSSVFLSYKNLVSQYLSGLRDHLKGDFLMGIVENLQTFSSDIEAITKGSGQSTKFNDALTNARIEFQASVRTVCGWLEIAQTDDLSQLFTLEQATQIGINYTRQVRQDFSPQITMEGDTVDAIHITGGSLIAIVDILFILLDNVYKHAGRPNERDIHLRFDLSEDGIIRIVLTNDVDPSKDLNDISARLLEAKKLLVEDESERKLMEEERSGIPKLSRLVMQDRGDSLTFELKGNTVIFNVLIGYSSLGSHGVNS